MGFSALVSSPGFLTAQFPQRWSRWLSRLGWLPDSGGHSLAGTGEPVGKLPFPAENKDTCDSCGTAHASVASLSFTLSMPVCTFKLFSSSWLPSVHRFDPGHLMAFFHTRPWSSVCRKVVQHGSEPLQSVVCELTLPAAQISQGWLETLLR